MIINLTKSETLKQWVAKHKDHIVKYQRNYYEQNKEKILAQNKQYLIDNSERLGRKEWISEYKKKWKKDNPDYYHKYYLRNKKEMYEKHKKYKIKHADKLAAKRRELYSVRKVKFFEMIGGPKCVYCGCEEAKILEVNHIEGVRVWLKKQGKSDQMTRKQMHFVFGRALMDRVVRGELSPEGLEVVCKVCNAAHYVKLKFGIDYKITCMPVFVANPDSNRIFE